MKALVDAVVLKIQNTPSLAAFSGTGPSDEAGPFFGIAPELTKPPYMTIMQIPGVPLTHAFTSTYVEPVQLQFDVRDTDVDAATANAETLCTVFDTLANLALTGGQLTRKPIRKESVRVLAENISGTGQRMYHAIAVYTFKVQRTKGS